MAVSGMRSARSPRNTASPRGTRYEHTSSQSLALSRGSMIKPPELDSEEGGVVWNALTASDDGDVDALRRLVERDPRLSRAEYWYTPAIHFAVREGHLEAVQLLLDAGADPEWNGLHDGSLIAMARDRGHAGDRAAPGRGAGSPRPRPGRIRQPSHSCRDHPRGHEGGPPAARRGSQASWTSATRSAHRRSIERSAVVRTSSPRCCSIAAPTCMPFSAPRAASAEGSGPIFRRSISPSGTGVAPETAA